MERLPRIARTANQRSVIGPNSAPTLPVPCFWIMNSAISIPAVIGRIMFSNCGVATEMPSTADSTEIAGVMIASP